MSMRPFARPRTTAVAVRTGKRQGHGDTGQFPCVPAPGLLETGRERAIPTRLSLKRDLPPWADEWQEYRSEHGLRSHCGAPRKIRMRCD
jgi:hypothetical protein